MTSVPVCAWLPTYIGAWERGREVNLQLVTRPWTSLENCSSLLEVDNLAGHAGPDEFVGRAITWIARRGWIF